MSSRAPQPFVVVEDDPMDVFFLKNTLAVLAPDRPVIVCVDAGEAFAALRRLAEHNLADSLGQPECVFVDLNLPVADGFAVIEWIRAEPKLADVPVVVVSGSDDPADIKRAFEAGADEFMPKPVTAEQLLAFLGGASVVPGDADPRLTGEAMDEIRA